MFSRLLWRRSCVISTTFYRVFSSLLETYGFTIDSLKSLYISTVLIGCFNEKSILYFLSSVVVSDLRLIKVAISAMNRREGSNFFETPTNVCIIVETFPTMGFQHFKITFYDQVFDRILHVSRNHVLFLGVTAFNMKSLYSTDGSFWTAVATLVLPEVCSLFKTTS